jgi:Trk K+ transport system NAD-binding subunit
LLSNDADNLRACQIAASSFRVPHIVAQVNEPGNTEAYTAAGAQPVSIPEAHITVLENLVQTPNVFRLLSHTSPNQEVIELEIGNPAIHDMPIHALRLPGRAVLMVIQRNGHFIPPRGDTPLELGDVVTVLASPEEVDEVCELLACT